MAEIDSFEQQPCSMDLLSANPGLGRIAVCQACRAENNRLITAVEIDEDGILSVTEGHCVKYDSGAVYSVAAAVVASQSPGQQGRKPV